MEYPRFLVLEASSYEEDAYPIAASWSISDGQLKDVMIRPEDQWRAWDVIRELSEDVDKCPVYVSEPYLYQRWLNTLYSAYGAEIPFEIYPASDLFQMSSEELEEELENLSSNLLLDLKVPEERVRTQLELFQRLLDSGLIEV